MNKTNQRSVKKIQHCFDRLTTSTAESKRDAFQDLSNSILQYFDHTNYDDASQELFSVELPVDIQSFTAVWLLRALVESRTALAFDNTEPQATTLFDRVFEKRLYKRIGLEPKQQGFQKIQALIEFAQGILQYANDLTGQLPDLRSVPEHRDNCLRHFNRKNGTSQLSSLFPRTLTRANNTRLKELFEAVEEYTEVVEEDPLVALDKVNRLCERYESDAIDYGSRDAVFIYGAIARNLKSAVNKHFKKLEAETPSTIEIAAIDKKYPLEQPDTMFTFHVKLTNKGSRPVRDITLDEIITDPQIQLDTRPTHWGTVYPRSSEIFGIDATVLTKCTSANILISLTWANIGGPRISNEMETVLTAQRADVDWDDKASVEPYSLEAVTDEQDLVGRKRELNTLQRLTRQQSIGSAFIFGQKRVGKTSIANAVSKILSSDPNQNWIVIYKGAGDYVATNAETTMKRLGYVLAEDLRKRVLGLSTFQVHDFEDGLAPLSTVVDEALDKTDAKLLFILDEFDEIPSDLLGRTNMATSFFLPIRQISIKPRCAFFLIGGENMREIMTNQGDRLNKFKPLRVDYFTRADWGDFTDLIRRPVDEWMSISQNALEVLFEWSAGNPYFAKFLAAQVSTAMMDKRQCDVSEVDMADAVESAAVSIGVNYFAHFWQDGIEVSAKDQDKIQLDRRLILVALAKLFRTHSIVTEASVKDELMATSGPKLGESSFYAILNDFVNRDVLVRQDGGEISPKVPLFKKWLTDRGVSELLPNIREADYLMKALHDEERSRVTDSEILDICDRLGRYKGKDFQATHVRAWLEQFGSGANQRLMYRLLLSMTVYDESTVRAKMKEALQIVTTGLRTKISPRQRVRRDIAVSYLETSQSKSGPSYCRLFRDQNKMSTDSFMTLEQIRRKVNAINIGRVATAGETFQRLVLLDDFAGTGGSLVSGLESASEILRLVEKAGIGIVLIVVAGFDSAYDSIVACIESIGVNVSVHFCDQYGDEDRAFSSESKMFLNESERTEARNVAESFGLRLEQKHPLGYGGTEALVAFYESCPNNTLPILWSHNNKWRPLFPRH